jgi:hypothetical protein
MAGLGRKTFSPGDVLTSSDVQGYLMDQSVMVFAGTAARASAIPSPSAGMVAYSTATSLQVYNGSAWVAATTGYGVASGTAASSTAISVAGTAYTLLTFTADSNLVVSTAGLMDVLLIGGGGGSWNNGTGSGGGGIANATVYLPAGTYAVDIGAGGASNQVGFSSTIGSTSIGAHVAPVAVGGGIGSTPLTGSASGQIGKIPAQSPFAAGSDGGTSAGGGAGGGGAGGNAVTTTGGAGGAGFDVTNFVGSSTLKAGGGGGGGQVTGGAAGSGGGGAGGGGAGNPGAGTANSGGGAGGIYTGAPTSGGSGIVYVRFKV